jgi:hypothetical protein
MMFNLEQDSGGRIACYLVPDAFTAIPAIRVADGEKEILQISANLARQAFVTTGRHETGLCCFVIDSTMIPDLSGIEDLEISDAETGILIYRRSRPRDINKKILRLETSLLPSWQLDDALESSFQYFAKSIERFGAETVRQLFQLTKVQSVYLSGRILYKPYSHFIENGFQIISTIQDPYEELAERLLVLSQVRRLNADVINWRDTIGFRDAIAFAEDLVGSGDNLDDEAALRRKARHMSTDVAVALSNPLMRALTTTRPDEVPGRGALASALGILSSMSVLGLRNDPDSFLNGVAEFLQLKPDTLPPVRPHGAASGFARTLKAAKLFDIIIEKDVELYQCVMEACYKVTAASCA